MPVRKMVKKTESRGPKTNGEKTRGKATAAMRNEIIDAISELTDSEVLDVLYRVGLGSKFLTCQMCGRPKVSGDFMKSFDVKMRSAYTCICKECAANIANSVDATGNAHGITKSSISNALEYLDKPYVESVYDTALLQDESCGSDLWKRYVRCLAVSKYRDLRFRDSDKINQTSSGYDTLIKDTQIEPTVDEAAENQEQYEINRRDTIKFCGYDPFINEAQIDKPRLYAKLVGFLDDQAKEDPFKLSSIIEIVKGLAQSEKLNDEITHILNDKANFMANGPLLNKMMDTRKKCLDTVQTLARDNGISINFNKNSSAGQQTLSGRIKKVTEENLREGKVNAFDVGTCEGMRQIAEISEAARAKQLGMSEDILREIKDTSTALVTSLTKECDEYREKYRILLRENLDLKEYMRDRGLIDEHNVAISSEV